MGLRPLIQDQYSSHVEVSAIKTYAEENLRKGPKDKKISLDSQAALKARIL